MQIQAFVRRAWRHRATRHVLAWGFIVGSFELLRWGTPNNRMQLMGASYSPLFLLVPAAIIYAHFALLTYALERRRYLAYALGLAGVLAGGTALLHAVRDYGRLTAVEMRTSSPSGAAGARGPTAAAAPGPNDGRTSIGVGGGPANDSSPLGEKLANVVFVLVAATGVRYVRRGIISFYEIQKLRALQLETELSLLKAQVNQHFLFNTLNNLYGLSLAAPEQMPEALLQLAELMRYQLDSSRQQQVTVGSEAAYLANYIGLEKLRLRANTQVEFCPDLPHPDRPLASGLLLLPLVENCFKHAVGPSGANHIRIELTQTDTTLTLRTDNTVPPHFRPAPSGLGLPNLKARLAQFYPAPRHRLSIEAGAARYVATLVLQV